MQDNIHYTKLIKELNNDNYNKKPLLCKQVKGFLRFDKSKMAEFYNRWGLSAQQTHHDSVQQYFANEKRRPRLFELFLMQRLLQSNTLLESACIKIADASEAGSGIAVALDLYKNSIPQQANTDTASLAGIKQAYTGTQEHPKERARYTSKRTEQYSAIIINRYNALSLSYGVPIGFEVKKNITLAQKRSNKLVALVSCDNPRQALPAAIRLENELNLYGKAQQCSNGLFDTLVQNKWGCKLSYKALSAIADPLDTLFGTSYSIIIASVLPKLINKTKDSAAKLGYSCHLLGELQSKPRITVTTQGYLLCDMCIQALCGKNLYPSIDINLKTESYTAPELSEKQLSKRAIVSAFNVFCPKTAGTDFGAVPRLACSPLGGRYRTTRSQVVAIHSAISKKTVLTSRQDYEGKISDAFLSAVYSYIVAVAKLVVAGVSPETVKVSVAAGRPQSIDGIEQEFLFRLGILYAKSALKNDVFFNENELPPPDFYRSVSAGATADYSNLISNVFSAGQKIFRLPLKRSADFLPDIKYLIKVLGAVSINICSGNITAAAVVEDSVLAETLKSCLGEGCGFSFANANTGILKQCFGDLIIAKDDITELPNIECEYIGITDNTGIIKGAEFEVSLSELYKQAGGAPENYRAKQTLQAAASATNPIHLYLGEKEYQPQIFLPMLDSSCKLLTKSFIAAGGKVEGHIVQEFTQDYLKQARLSIQKSNIIAFSAVAGSRICMKNYISSLIMQPVIFDAINELLFRRDGLMLAFGEAFYSLLELGFLPYGRYVDDTSQHIKLIQNKDLFTSKISRCKIASNSTPWLAGIPVDTMYAAISANGEKRIEITDEEISKLIANNQICSQYVDFTDTATMQYPYNPTGNTLAIESLCSPDGRIYGSVGHNFKVARMFNIKESFDLELFKHAIEYFR